MAMASVVETAVTETTVSVDGDGGTGDSASSGTMLLLDLIFSTQNRKLTQIEKKTHQFPTSGKYCARYKSTSRFGTAIQTSFNSFTIAIIRRCTHLSVLMVSGGNS